ncbi:MAG: alpha/beta fold hydrolase [Pseudonocardia sp.]|nr:alpha/beta fold hydrolase [Pseudonocardia sp.]
MPRSAGRRREPAGLAAGIAVLVVVVALLSGCAVGPSIRPPVAIRGSSAVDGGAPNAPGSGQPVEPRIPVPDVGVPNVVDFADCTDEIAPVRPLPVPPDRVLRYECADLPVGVDSATGRHRQSSIGLMRVTLAGQTQPKPPLLVLGDSDGETGTLRAARLGSEVPLDLLRNFSLVGMDRRGQGTSHLDCAPPDMRSAILDTDLSSGNPQAADTLLENVRRVVQECYLAEGETIANYDTQHTARDVERARLLLGVHTLSAIGLGDGARALAVWAQNSPESVGRLVLDAPPDPTTDVIGTAEARATAAEGTFDAFARICASHPGCPLGPDPKTALRRLVDQLHTRPELGADGDRLTGAGVTNAVLVGLDDPASWPELAAAIGSARTGNPAGLLKYLDQLVGPNGRFDLALATTCNDTAQRISPPQVLQLISKWRVDHPLFGPLMAQRLLLCSAWPVPADPAEVGPAVQDPPMLVLATALSPREPLQSYQRAANRLVPAKVVSWQGAGRDAYPHTPCVTSAVDELLIDGTVPDTSVLCPP